MSFGKKSENALEMNPKENNDSYLLEDDDYLQNAVEPMKRSLLSLDKHNTMNFVKSNYEEPLHNIMSFGKKFDDKLKSHSIRDVDGIGIKLIDKRSVHQSTEKKESFQQKIDDPKSQTELKTKNRNDQSTEISENNSDNQESSNNFFLKNIGNSNLSPVTQEKKSDSWDTHNTLHFGKKSGSWDSHNTMHFGKKYDPWSSHNTMHFGKKFDPWSSHNTMHFGKKSDSWDSHTMHFGKKSNPWESHNTMHFGKKSDPWSSHNTMHFGKKFDSMINLNDMSNDKKDVWDNHNTLHFGKKSEIKQKNDYQNPEQLNFNNQFASEKPIELSFLTKTLNNDLLRIEKRSPILFQEQHLKAPKINTASLNSGYSRTEANNIEKHSESKLNNKKHIEKEVQTTAIPKGNSKLQASATYQKDQAKKEMEKHKESYKLSEHSPSSKNSLDLPDAKSVNLKKRSVEAIMIPNSVKCIDDCNTDDNEADDIKNLDEPLKVLSSSAYKIYDGWGPYQYIIQMRKKSNPWDLHNTMHFGKKFDPWDNHNTMHFGKRSEPWQMHDTMHFGKKRDPFGAHNTMHFGKRYDPWQDHNTMHFGKKLDPWQMHNTMHFGKRSAPWETHNTMHFGKRFDDDSSLHNVMHFGKRDQEGTLHEKVNSFNPENDSSFEHLMTSILSGKNYFPLNKPFFYAENSKESYPSLSTDVQSAELSQSTRDQQLDPALNVRLHNTDDFIFKSLGKVDELSKEHAYFDKSDSDSNEYPETVQDSEENTVIARMPIATEDDKMKGYLRMKQKLLRRPEKRYLAPFQGPNSLIYPNAWLVSQIRRSSSPYRHFELRMAEKKEDPLNSFMHFGRR